MLRGSGLCGRERSTVDKIAALHSCEALRRVKNRGTVKVEAAVKIARSKKAVHHARLQINLPPSLCPDEGKMSRNVDSSVSQNV